MTNNFSDLLSTWPSTRAELADWLKEAIGSVRATKIDEPAFHSVQLVHRAYRHLLDLGAPASTLNAVVMPVSGDPGRLYAHFQMEVVKGYPDTLARLHAAHEWAAATVLIAADHDKPADDKPAGETSGVGDVAERVGKLTPAQREAVKKDLGAKADLEQLIDGPPETWRRLAESAGVRDEDFETWKKNASLGLKKAGIPTHAQPGGRESRSAVRPAGRERVGKSGKTG